MQNIASNGKDKALYADDVVIILWREFSVIHILCRLKICMLTGRGAHLTTVSDISSD